MKKNHPATGNLNSVQDLTVINLTARYPSKNYPSIIDISFSLKNGDMMAILGPSGSGKSSIIKALLGNMIIEKGGMYVNGQLCSNSILCFKRHLGYVPQDDILNDTLTVYENLFFYQKLKSCFNENDSDIKMNIDAVLTAFEMEHKKNKRIVSSETKLSGGQRKKLNIAMELLNKPDILILDEPTSGLSSNDAEKMISFLKGLTCKGTIIILIIHQPSSVIYKMFDKVLVINKEGKELFFGDPLKALVFFHEMYENLDQNEEVVECPVCKKVNPDLLLTVQDGKSDEYWRTFNQGGEIPSVSSFRGNAINGNAIKKPPVPESKPLTMKDALGQISCQIKRQFISKSRDRLNQLLSFVMPPLLGALSAFVFRYAPEETDYSIAGNTQYPHFLFLMVITGLFLGLMSSVFEILKDEGILKRENMSDISTGGYFFAKLIILLLFGLIQSWLFVGPAHLILGLGASNIYWVNGGVMILITAIGIGFGLLFSTLTPSVLAAYNLVPLILIPQIILGGGFLPYDQMGKGVYIFENAFSLVCSGKTDARPAAKGSAPFLARLLPSSWAFELLVSGNYDLHPLKRLNDEKQTAINHVSKKFKYLKDQLASQGKNTDNLELQKEKEKNRIIETYRKKETELPPMNEEIKNKSIKKLRGEFLAQQHWFFKGYEGNQIYDRFISKTWFLDGMVLLCSFMMLHVIGYVQVKRIIKRR